ncbi:MAG: aspartyl/asparaginyl beta-hydroxylase domain-containing protein [Planctomycetes bacterium]|nr:aspartyl/asparaginyl beta-hydroxylase domain-containing protein [Planctomycetota bacterium]
MLPGDGICRGCSACWLDLLNTTQLLGSSLAAASAFALGSMRYVYAHRGKLRYEGLREYVRKGWPIFAPFNCLLYLFTKPKGRGVFLGLENYPELAPLQEGWQVIREEAMQLMRQGYFERISDRNSASYFDVGFRTFYKYGWSKFYLRWYGYTHASALALCPKTVAILSRIPSVNGAMFSLLPPGSKLTRHLDPVAISLRYHLGLSTPNRDGCSIEVDGQTYSWRDGAAALFDITYLHHARNDTDHPRLILMCDIDRPMSWPGAVINWFYRGLARISIVPNLEGDRRGLANRLFAGVAPLFARTKVLRQSNRRLYNWVKWGFNLTLLGAVAAVLYGMYRLLLWCLAGG